MTPQRMAARLRRIAARLLIEADRALRELAQATYREALTMSSGRVRQEVFGTPFGESFAPSGRKLTLHRSGMSSGLGHPYGIGSTGSLGPRGPIPYGDPAKINVQSGRFFRAWHVQSAGTRVYVLLNDSPEARYLVDGTTLMIRRPILDRLQASADRRAHAFAALALYRATH